jgi:hypothetical protein
VCCEWQGFECAEAAETSRIANTNPSATSVTAMPMRPNLTRISPCPSHSHVEPRSARSAVEDAVEGPAFAAMSLVNQPPKTHRNATAQGLDLGPALRELFEGVRVPLTALIARQSSSFQDRCENARLRNRGLGGAQAEFVDEVRVLRQQPALQLVALLARHGRDIERVAADGLLVVLFLQLAAVDQLHVTDRRSSSFGRLPCSDADSKRSQNVRPVVVVERPPSRLVAFATFSGVNYAGRAATRTPGRCNATRPNVSVRRPDYAAPDVGRDMSSGASSSWRNSPLLSERP